MSYTLAITLAGASTLFSQQELDSLTKRLNSNPPDTTRIDIYLRMSTEDLEDSLKEAHLFRAIALSDKIADRKRWCLAYLALARVYDYAEDLKAAHEALATVEPRLKELNTPSLTARFYQQRGIIYYFEGNYTKAIADLWSAVRILEPMGNSSGAAGAFLNIGNSYKELENLDKALEYYIKSMELYRAAGNEYGVSLAEGNIGNIYRAKKSYDSAITYIKRSLSYNRRMGNSGDVRVDLNNLGFIYFTMRSYDSALLYFNEAFKVAERSGSARGMWIARFNIGLIAYEHKQYSKAIALFEELLVQIQQSNNKEELKDIYEALSRAHESAGNYSLALMYRKQYEVWKDSLISTDHLDEVKELEIRYESEKKDKQIVLLAQQSELEHKEAERQSAIKTAFMIGFLMVSVIAGLVFFLFRQRLRNQKLLTAKNEEIKDLSFRRQLAELEMKALRAQINPHFLFNCINSINRMVVAGDRENASIYLKRFAKLVRSIVENAESMEVSLASELSLIESYVQLEELRFPGKINFTIHVDDDVDKENTMLPPMVLQPFVENAIWHGLMHKDKSDPGQITIAIGKRTGLLQCSIEDNGVGRERSQQLKEASIVKTKSMGIKITEERLKLINGQTVDSLIRVIDLNDASRSPRGTRVEIDIPLTYEEV